MSSVIRHLSSPRPRVLVTGIGLVTSLGPDRESTWRALRVGQTGARRIDLDGLDAHDSWHGFPAVDREGRRGALALLDAAADEAWSDADLDRHRPDPSRVATLIGMSKPGASRLANRAEPWLDAWPMAGSSRVAARLGLTGPSGCPVAACATGLIAALQGVLLIRSGTCDVALVGASDASLEPIWLATFRKMRVLARSDDPADAIRPLDRRRTGFLVGEGAAVLVLEREDHAHARHAPIYAELVGGALGSDAFHPTDLNPDPEPLAALIARALDDAGVPASEIDHVNLHGTATRANDPVECAAVRLALGPSADLVAGSANKAQLGHLLGAAGAAELALACLAIRDGFVPPTLNLSDPDPACDLDATPLVGRPRAIRAALKLSLGFGGHLAAAVLRRPSESDRRGPRAIDLAPLD